MFKVRLTYEYAPVGQVSSKSFNLAAPLLQPFAHTVLSCRYSFQYRKITSAPEKAFYMLILL
jgi:hypothetical protein